MGRFNYTMRAMLLAIGTLSSAWCSAQVFAPLRTVQEERARELTESFRYDEAYPYWANLAQLYLDGVGGAPEFIRSALESATASERYDEALKWTRILVDRPEATVEDWRHYVWLLKVTGGYAAVPEVLDSGQAAFPEDSILGRYRSEWPMVQVMLKDTGVARVRAYRPGAEHEEFAAVPRRGGLAFVTRGVHSGFSVDGWTSQPWTKVAFVPDTSDAEPRFSAWQELRNKDLFPGLDQTNHHDGPVAFSQDQDVAALTRNQQVFDTTGRVNRSALQLVFFEAIIGGDWIGPEPFPYNSPEWSTGHACFDPKGDIVFASDRPGGYGGVDLWRSKKQGGTWGEPYNLGPVVNSPGDEVFPFMSQDSVLYFASNGWTGLGGLDLFSWLPRASNLEHLPIPINSPADDFALVVEPDGEGWLSSNRGDWKDRIYRLEMPVAEVSWEILVRACDTRPLEGVEVEMTDVETGLVYRASTDRRGLVQFRPRLSHQVEVQFLGNDSMAAAGPIARLALESAVYRDTLIVDWLAPKGEITVRSTEGAPLSNALLTFTRKDGTVRRESADESGRYIWQTQSTLGFHQVAVDLINFVPKRMPLAGVNGCARPERYAIVMEAIESEELIDLDLILYDLDKANLRWASKQELDKLVRYLQARPELRVELSSHTDSRASFEYNQDLSQRRAQSCVDYIIGQGVSSTRIIARGYGETQLVNHCGDGVECSEELHQQNRRTELRLLTD